jgi:hypothetical protein
MTAGAPETETPDTSAYADQRARDWAEFTAREQTLPDYWALWEERSHGWRVPIEFLQPIGADSPRSVEPLRPLLDTLAELEEIDPIPVEWMHLTTIHVGFLMATDIMWSQVESFYVNASPRLHRIAPFTLRLGGISATEDGIYLGVDDGLAFREVRRQARLGVPRVHEAMKDDSLLTPEGDLFIPRIEIAVFTGKGDRRRVVEALEPYLDAEAGELPVTHIKMARVPIQPHDHYHPIDVIAEIILFGENYRQGYHD